MLTYISAGVEDGAMTINFAFNSKIKHRHLVHRWIERCSDVLRELIRTTAQQSTTSLTLSDLPRMTLTYDELSALVNTVLPGVGIHAENIQDIYPCSPMQTALLVSQALDPTLYAVRYLWEVTSPSSRAVLEADIIAAWKHVVKRHAMLRTVFVQTNSSSDGTTTSTYCQVALKDFEPNVLVCNTATTFPLGRPEHHIRNGPPHQLLVTQQPNGTVQIQLDISHTLIDGTSVGLLLDQLAIFYGGTTAWTGNVMTPTTDTSATWRTKIWMHLVVFGKAILAMSTPAIFRVSGTVPLGTPETTPESWDMSTLSLHRQKNSILSVQKQTSLQPASTRSRGLFYYKRSLETILLVLGTWHQGGIFPSRELRSRLGLSSTCLSAKFL